MSNHQRERIPQKVRNDLWIAAAGRCEFKGCTKPIGIDFLTGEKATVGEYAHIIADSPKGPRGDEIRSQELAISESNLFLACFDCHGRVDRVKTIEDYPETLLKRWKTDHEDAISRIYESGSATKSLMILMAFPIGSHLPAIDTNDAIKAILKNSDYTVHPDNTPLILNRSNFDIQDHESDFWMTANRSIERWYTTTLLPRLSETDAPSHLSVAAFAPIPLMVKLGSLIGNKIPTQVMDLPDNKWRWHNIPDSTTFDDECFTFSVPASLPERVFLPIEISNYISDIIQIQSEHSVVKFTASQPMRELIKCQKHLDKFKTRFNQFANALHAAGARELDLLPVTSLCTSVEIGRILLPKIFKRVGVWEFRNSNWTHALDIVSQ
jgi:hypothetical protein